MTVSQKLGTNILAGASDDIDNNIPSRALLVSDDGIATSAEDHTHRKEIISDRGCLDIDSKGILKTGSY